MKLVQFGKLFRKKEEGIKIGISTAPPRNLLVPVQAIPGHKEITSYSIEEGYSMVKLFQNLNEGGYLYFVIEPILTPREKSLYEDYKEEVKGSIPEELRFTNVTSMDLKKKRLRKYIVNRAISEGYPRRTGEKIYYYLYRDLLFLGPLTVPVLDRNMIEDITLTQGQVFLYHKLYGSISTNIKISDYGECEELVKKVVEIGGRHISYVEPLADSSLEDGSRVQAILGSGVSLTGPSITIRKFSEKPFTPIDIIRSGEASPEIYAYLWLLVEYFANMMIIGGTATGKTTLLNSILMFAKPYTKIVSIEDTREINLYHENWIPAVTKPAVGVINAQGVYEKVGEITLMDLIKNSLRQRPEYIIVGEVRGSEAIYMFQAMATGKTGYTTFHAESIESAVRRLTQPPLNVPESQLSNIDVFIIIRHAMKNNKPVRRIFEVLEYFFDSTDGKMKVNPFFTWDYVSDTFIQNISSMKLKRISELRGIPLSELYMEMDERAKYLKGMVDSGKVYDVESFTSEIMKYYLKKGVGVGGV